MAVNIFQRQNLNLAECLVSYILHNLISHFIIADIHKPLGKRGHKRTHADLNHDPEYAWEIHFPCADNVIHRIPGQFRHIKGQGH